jgi:alpha-1,2-mannosyltransferase
MTSGTGTVRAGAPAVPRHRAVTWQRVLVIVLIVAGTSAGQFWYGNRHNFYDLRIYFGAIRWWAQGHPLYDYSVPDKIQGTLGFTYPPFAALLMYPMSWLLLGFVIWVLFVANAVAIVVTTVWLVYPLADRHGWPRWYALAIALPMLTALEPIRETVTFGQINLLLALLVLGDLLLLVPRGSRWAGIGVGLATAVKLTPAIFIVYLLITRRWWAAALSSATAAGATLLAAAIAPGDSWRYWTHTVWETNRVGHLERFANQSLWGGLLRAAHPRQPSPLLWLGLVAVLAGYGLWCAARAARAGDGLTGVTITGLLGTLVSPVSWQHHLYWFAPALVLLVDAYASRVRHRGWYLGVAIVVWVSVAVSVISLFADYGLPWSVAPTAWGFLIMNWYLLLMLLLLAILPIRSLRRL